MLEMVSSFMPSLRELVVGLIIGLLLASLFGAGRVMKWVGPKVWEFIISGAKARKRAAVGEVRKRVLSDSYFVAHQNAEAIAGLLWVNLIVIILVVYGLDESVAPSREFLILPLAVLQLALFLLFAWETDCNRKAVDLRLRIEKKKRFPRLARGK